MTEALNYICANSTEGLVLAQGASGPVLHQSAQVVSEIERRCGADVAALFAHPTFKSSPESTIVSWYCVAQGSPRPLSEFDEIGQRPYAEILQSRLARLLPILADPEMGAVVGAALNVRSSEDIYIVGRDPIVVNWGLLPRQAAASEAARESHFRETLGAFVPGLPPPPVTFRDARSFTESIRDQTRAAESRDKRVSAGAAGKEGADATPVLGPAAIPKPRKRWTWVAPLVACVLAGSVLGALTIPGVLGFAQIVSPDQAVIDGQRKTLQEVNKSLEEQISALKRESSKLVCRALPGTANATILPSNLLPPAPQNVPVQPPIAGGPTNAAQLADQSVVLVRAKFRSGDVSGSAFFINDHLLVTNDHVVDDEGSDARMVTIENKTLGRRVPAKIVARTNRRSDWNADFALLEVPANTSKSFLKLAAQPAKSTPVRSVGFPGVLLSVSDATIPESSMTDGSVSTYLRTHGQSLLVHTAVIFPGNS
jgi:hypothetical protein